MDEVYSIVEKLGKNEGIEDIPVIFVLDSSEQFGQDKYEASSNIENEKSIEWEVRISNEWPPEVAEIQCQIENSDRIITGNVTDIEEFDNYTLVTIGISEWLMNPLPQDEIVVRTEIGISSGVVGEATFYQNEGFVLMLKAINASKNEFKVTFAENGKHNLSEKERIMKELPQESPFIGLVGPLIAVLLVVFLCRRSR
ncbi:hypothetical protein HNV12_14915 [Methanococcoides sp. SA1]|nr:hypothetical protein [Methanococcoides sp. SA1]